MEMVERHISKGELLMDRQRRILTKGNLTEKARQQAVLLLEGLEYAQQLHWEHHARLIAKGAK